MKNNIPVTIFVLFQSENLREPFSLTNVLPSHERVRRASRVMRECGSAPAAARRTRPRHGLRPRKAAAAHRARGLCVISTN